MVCGNESTAFDWRPLQSRPPALSLGMATPSLSLQSGEKFASINRQTYDLQSQDFALEPGTVEQLRFSSKQHGTSGSCQVLLACRVELEDNKGTEIEIEYKKYLYKIRRSSDAHCPKLALPSFESSYSNAAHRLMCFVNLTRALIP